MKKIYLAGGCFWGVQAYFDQKNGIIKTIVGYANGITENPSYEDVCTGLTNHAETVYIEYDENIIELSKILKYFWRIIDPIALNRQGPDNGTQYRSGIYYVEDADLDVINDSLLIEQKKYESAIVTEVEPLKCFYEAEDYHQKYLLKNPRGYCHIDLSL